MRPGRLFNTSAAVASPEQPASADSVTVSQSDFDNLKLSYKKLTSIKRSLSRNELSATFAAEVEDEDFEEKGLGDVIPSRFVGVSFVDEARGFERKGGETRRGEGGRGRGEGGRKCL